MAGRADPSGGAIDDLTHPRCPSEAKADFLRRRTSVARRARSFEGLNAGTPRSLSCTEIAGERSAGVRGSLFEHA